VPTLSTQVKGNHRSWPPRTCSCAAQKQAVKKACANPLHAGEGKPRVLVPADVLKCSTEALRGCGLSGQKASYVLGIAAAFAAAEAEAEKGKQVHVA